ncbi:hypothetical protein SSP35_05_02570 [Streptomyces sp. NBRC 110611]|uniref:hypothetical protein n=1 Tax=Streptomyces sp. NBRC 110611 TaxID=1621259 RepID=UPI00082BEBA1|nr:hypothetical protein [Streptomyces sp. NBRC 110611]GAU67690.1 hypothetical protein SSP35_05_02570 [Streptomyces sp. NBRC 110611]
MTVRAAWLLPTGQTREDTRLAPVGPMTPEGELRSRDGVIAGGDPLKAAGVASMQVQISTGRALVQGTDAQGAYPIAVTAPETLTLADGDAQHPRVDSVVLRVLDPLYDTSDQPVATLEIVQGAPSATPAPPRLPGACLRLWDITVPAGASAGVGGINWASALADRRRYTAAAGGIIPRGWGLSFPGAYPGQYRDNGTGLDRWDGNDWRSVAERHYVAVRKDESYSLAANRYTNVWWTGTDARTDASMWTPANPTRLVAPVSGLYTVYAQQTWPGGAEQARVLVVKNGVREWHVSFVARSNGGQGHAAALPVVLKAGDYIEVRLYTATAVDNVPGTYSYAALRWEGPA